MQPLYVILPDEFQSRVVVEGFTDDTVARFKERVAEKVRPHALATPPHSSLAKRPLCALWAWPYCSCNRDNREDLVSLTALYLPRSSQFKTDISRAALYHQEVSLTDSDVFSKKRIALFSTVYLRNDDTIDQPATA